MKTLLSISFGSKTSLLFFCLLFSGISLIAQLPEGGAYYLIHAKHSDKVLDVRGGTEMQDNGVMVQLWEVNQQENQQFRFEDAGNGYYRIVARHSGKGLDVTGGSCAKGNGAAIQQWENGNHGNQLFKLVHQGNGYYMIVAKHSGKAIDVYGGEDENGTQVIQYEARGTENQLFSFIRAGAEILTGEEY
ncbi:MAG: RICIN domain-containing protein [Bacteroidia bacterium]